MIDGISDPYSLSLGGALEMRLDPTIKHAQDGHATTMLSTCVCVHRIPQIQTSWKKRGV